ncbi:hypothetical protein FWH13_03945 [Candidatus Saccharibacteria bacterium]|nr:hypothetical protein [Candidatus Saccharibacteria bacterium]
MKKKLLGIFLASVSVLAAIGAAGVVNQTIGASPGEVPVLVQVGNQMLFSIIDPVDTFGTPTTSTSPYDVQISWSNVSRLTAWSCSGAEIPTCPTGVAPAGSVDLSGITGIATIPVDFSNGPGLYRIFVMGYDSHGVAVNAGSWVEINYLPETVDQPSIILQSINGQPITDQGETTISSNEVELVLSYANTQQIEILENGNPVSLTDCVPADPVAGTLRCKFVLSGPTDGAVHNLVIRYLGTDGVWYTHSFRIIVDDADVPGTGMLRIGGMAIGREDLLVSALVLIVAIAVMTFYFALRYKDSKRAKKSAARRKK